MNEFKIQGDNLWIIKIDLRPKLVTTFWLLLGQIGNYRQKRTPDNQGSRNISRINRVSHAVPLLPNTENENARFKGVSEDLVTD